jgi:hypothetical protein
MARKGLSLRALVSRAFRAMVGVPPILSGTARLGARVDVLAMTRWTARTWAVEGIDLENRRPRLRLSNGPWVDAGACEAMPDPRRRVLRGRGSYVVPGPDRTVGVLRPGAEVTAVTSWRELSGAAVVLARWPGDDAQLFGVFNAEDLAPVPEDRQ